MLINVGNFQLIFLRKNVNSTYIIINKKLIALRFPRICLVYAQKNLKRLSEITLVVGV